MKKNKLIVFCCLVSIFFPAIVFGANGLYLGANFGVVLLDDSDVTDSTMPFDMGMEFSFDPGWTIGAAVGYQINNFRVEGEISYEQCDVDQTTALGVSFDSTGDVTGTAFMLNGYYDFKNESAFIPYVGAGLGYANVEINDYNIPGSGVADYSADDSVFAYQFGVGIGYAINEKVTLDLKYRYFATDDPEFDTSEVEISGQKICLGVKYNF